MWLIGPDQATAIAGRFDFEGGRSYSGPMPKPRAKEARSPSTSSGRSRIDALLVERGLLESRERARAVLLAGEVRVDGVLATGPGLLVPCPPPVEVLKRPPSASRGGDKLAHALATFAIDPSGLTCVDVGASTGGFTDCLLQHGARRGYAVDVGHRPARVP